MDGLSRLQRPKTQRKQKLTRDYIDAGRDLIMEALDHDPQSRESHPFLSWISQRRLAKRVERNTDREATTAALRDRWKRHSDYLRDLVDHIRSRRASRSFPVRERERIARSLSSEGSASQVVRELGREVLCSIFDDDFFRLQLVTLAALGSPRYRDAAEEESAAALYREVDRKWQPIFDAYLEKFGREPRPGIDRDGLIEMTTALSEGFALRELADPTTGARREERLRRHSTAMLALVYALTVESGGGAGSIDKAVDGGLEA